MQFVKRKVVHVNSILTKTNHVKREERRETERERETQTQREREKERERERERERGREREGLRERDRERVRARDPAQHTLLLGKSLGTQRRKIHRVLLRFTNPEPNILFI